MADEESTVYPYVLQAIVMTGKAKGQDIFILIILLISSVTLFEFKLSCTMSINKSQGQLLKVVGLNLTTPKFTHRQ
ncbi:hypothetical protein Pmani_014229 [Petrolisthes manimaculis]|uniref:Uncharacterized protein n=1 Tax=Petrolisthes manimaculis TaxID=1843537 RepID=A0AAE1UDC3_9EUCA|nr:hypothetical protein Pmani_014229 [Petrolisthes manimaculis]